MSITRIGGTHRYSDIVINGRTVYLSGVVPSKDNTVYEQTKEVLEQISNLLKCAGSSNRDILNMTIYLRDEASYEEMNRAFDEWIPKDCAPARATIGNVRFPNPMWKVEITVIAHIPFINNSEKPEAFTRGGVNYII